MRPLSKNSNCQLLHYQQTNVNQSSFKNLYINESRNFMQMILAIKMKYQKSLQNPEQTVKSHKKIQESQLQKQICLQNQSYQPKKLNLGFQRIKCRKVIQKGGIIFTKQEKQEENGEPQCPDLLKQVLLLTLRKTEFLKTKLKNSKGLPLDKIFVTENFHLCIYCGKKFDKPCSLGGHISKLHPEKKKAQRVQKRNTSSRKSDGRVFQESN